MSGDPQWDAASAARPATGSASDLQVGSEATAMLPSSTSDTLTKSE
jgi:hypothetical protein